MVPGSGIRSVKVPPSGDLPITVEQAKKFCRDNTQGDTELDELFTSALMGGFTSAEHHLDRAILQQTRLWNFTRQPEDLIRIEPYSEVIVRRAVNGEWETVEPSMYSTAGEQGEIFPVPETNPRWGVRFAMFPEVEGIPVGAYYYQVEAVVGWANQTLPHDIRQAILAWVKDVYDHRGIRDIGRPLVKPWAGVEDYSWRFG